MKHKRIRVKKHLRKTRKGKIKVQSHLRSIKAKKLKKTAQVKTYRGTYLKRNPNYGVGKTIGSFIYIHRLYEELLPKRVREAKKLIPKDFNYAIIKFNENTGEVSFIKSDDFYTSNEPIVGDSWKIKTDNSISFSKSKKNQIYHHKWLFVKEDFPFFNVQDSISHSKLWIQIPGIDHNKIGNKNYWDKIVIPQINRLRITQETGYKKGIVTDNPVLTNYLLCSEIPKDTKILDFGAGLDAIQTQRLLQEFPETKAYDYPATIEASILNNPDLKELFDPDALEKKYDIIMASNVLNVQPDISSLEKTLDDIYCNMDIGTRLLVNVPREPIKLTISDSYTPIKFPELKKIIFNELEKRFDGKNIKLIKEVCDKKTSTLVYQLNKTDRRNEPIYCEIEIKNKIKT